MLLQQFMPTIYQISSKFSSFSRIVLQSTGGWQSTFYPQLCKMLGNFKNSFKTDSAVTCNKVMVKRPTTPKSRWCTTLWSVVNHNTFQIVAVFSSINISQGSVVIRLRCGGIFYYCFDRNLLLKLLVKEFQKPASIYQGHRQKYNGTFFWTWCIRLQWYCNFYIKNNKNGKWFRKHCSCCSKDQQKRFTSTDTSLVLWS